MTVDTFSIGEKIELGIRVREYRVEAWVDGQWKQLAQKRSMGYLWAERFDRVTTDRVRILILDAVAAPVLRHFGLYTMPDSYYEAVQAQKNMLKTAVDLAHLPNAKIIPEEQGVKVEFGGIYPFNMVCFRGGEIGEYEIHAVNGSSYECVHRGRKPGQYEIVRLQKTVEHAYQMKLITFRENNEDLDLKIFEQS